MGAVEIEPLLRHASKDGHPGAIYRELCLYSVDMYAIAIAVLAIAVIDASMPIAGQGIVAREVVRINYGSWVYITQVSIE